MQLRLLFVSSIVIILSVIVALSIIVDAYDPHVNDPDYCQHTQEDTICEYLLIIWSTSKLQKERVFVIGKSGLIT